MGIVVDHNKAKASQCTCFYIGDADIELPILFDRTIRDTGINPDDVMCFSQGIIGTLNDAEDKMYCNGGIIKESKGLRERLKCMSELAHTCR